MRTSRRSGVGTRHGGGVDESISGKGALATTAIEGNTLSEIEARKRVDGVKDLPPSKAYLGIEIDNIIAASNIVLEQCRSDQPPVLNADLILQFNASVLANLELDPDVQPGTIRRHSVGVADYRGAPWKIAKHYLKSFVPG